MKPELLYQLAEWDKETVFVDVETTGLDPDSDRIVEIAIVNESGDVLMNTLVNPRIKIPQDVAAITHKITDKMVKDRPTFKEIENDIICLLSGKRMVSYNAEFECKFLTDAVKREISIAECCMRRFVHYHMYLVAKSRNRVAAQRYLSLRTAAKFVGYKWKGEWHRALADTMACREVWLHLDKKESRVRALRH